MDFCVPIPNNFRYSEVKQLSLSVCIFVILYPDHPVLRSVLCFSFSVPLLLRSMVCVFHVNPLQQRRVLSAYLVKAFNPQECGSWFTYLTLRCLVVRILACLFEPSAAEESVFCTSLLTLRCLGVCFGLLCSDDPLFRSAVSAILLWPSPRQECGLWFSAQTLRSYKVNRLIANPFVPLFTYLAEISRKYCSGIQFWN